MALDELFEDAERLKIRFVAGFDRLLQKGLLSEAQFEEILEIIDRLDELSEEELTEKLEVMIKQVEELSQSSKDQTIL